MEEHRLAANALFKSGKLDEAIATYQMAVDAFLQLPAEERPFNVDEASKSIGNMLMCYHKLGRFDECIAKAHEMLKVNPFLAKAHGFLGMSMLDAHKDKPSPPPTVVYEAHRCFAYALALLPDIVNSLKPYLATAREAMASSSAPAAEGGESPITIEQCAGAGRGVVASRDLGSFEKLCDFGRPFSIGTYRIMEKLCVCVACGKTDADEYILCPKCKSVAFCSETCAAIYSRRHAEFECDRYIRLKAMMQALEAQGSDVPEDFEDVAAHVITTMSGLKAGLDSQGFIDKLEGHDDEVVQALGPTAMLMWELCDSDPQPLVSHVVGVIRSNSLQLSDKSGLGVGEALYDSTTSLFNHSCSPNAMLDMENRCVKTIRSIDKGEPLCISYIPQLFWPTRLRREGLTERYFFTCRCARCLGDDPYDRICVAELPGARPTATSYYHPVVQNLCCGIRERAVEDIDLGAVKELNELLGEAGKHLHQLHYLMHDLRNALTFVHTVLGNKAETFASCLNEIAVWEVIAPGAHPVKGDKLSCALLCCEHTEDAVIVPQSESTAPRLAGSYFTDNLVEYARIFRP